MEVYVYNNTTNKILDKILIEEQDLDGFDYMEMGDSVSFISLEEVTETLSMGQSDIDDCELIFSSDATYIQSLEKPFPSWTKDSNGLWVSPAGTRPENVENVDGGYSSYYLWDEDAQVWVEQRVNL